MAPYTRCRILQFLLLVIKEWNSQINIEEYNLRKSQTTAKHTTTIYFPHSKKAHNLPVSLLFSGASLSRAHGGRGACGHTHSMIHSNQLKVNATSPITCQTNTWLHWMSDHNTDKISTLFLALFSFKETVVVITIITHIILPPCKVDPQ